MSLKSTAINLTIVSTLLLSVTPALAVDSSPSAKGVEKKCETVIKRLDQRIDQYDKTKDTHLIKYKNTKDNFLALAERLDKKGYDTSKLRADGKTLDDKIATAAADYQSFIQKLEAAKQYPCQTSQGTFKKAMQDARTQLKVFHSDVKDIRNFFKTVIRPDLQAIRAQKQIKESTKSSNE